MKVCLEALDYKHLGWLRHQRNRRDVMDFCRQPFLINEVMQEDWFKNVSRSKEMIVFVITLKGKGREGRDLWVGYAALSNICWIAKRAEVSLFIVPEEKEKGYGNEGLHILCNYAFRTLGMQKLGSDTFDFNDGEVAWMKEEGFKEYGRLPRHYYKRGRLVDSIIIALFAEEWKPNEELMNLEAAIPRKPL